MRSGEFISCLACTNLNYEVSNIFFYFIIITLDTRPSFPVYTWTCATAPGASQRPLPPPLQSRRLKKNEKGVKDHPFPFLSFDIAHTNERAREDAHERERSEGHRTRNTTRRGGVKAKTKTALGIKTVNHGGRARRAYRISRRQAR